MGGFWLEGVYARIPCPHCGSTDCMGITEKHLYCCHTDRIVTAEALRRQAEKLKLTRFDLIEERYGWQLRLFTHVHKDFARMFGVGNVELYSPHCGARGVFPDVKSAQAFIGRHRANHWAHGGDYYRNGMPFVSEPETPREAWKCASCRQKHAGTESKVFLLSGHVICFDKFEAGWKPRSAAKQKRRAKSVQNIAVEQDGESVQDIEVEQNETPPHMRYHIYHEVDGNLYHLNSVFELPDMTPSTFIDWHFCETFADIRAALGKSLSSPRVQQKRIVTPHVLRRDGESGPVVDERLDCSMGN